MTPDCKSKNGFTQKKQRPVTQQAVRNKNWKLQPKSEGDIDQSSSRGFWPGDINGYIRARIFKKS